MKALFAILSILGSFLYYPALLCAFVWLWFAGFHWIWGLAVVALIALPFISLFVGRS